MTGPEPDVRVVVLGVRSQERKLRQLWRERARAEKEGREVLSQLLRKERELKRLQRGVQRGP